jgi:hypothetical protein
MIIAHVCVENKKQSCAGRQVYFKILFEMYELNTDGPVDNFDVLVNIFFLFLGVFGGQCVVKFQEMYLNVQNALTVASELILVFNKCCTFSVDVC